MLLAELHTSKTMPNIKARSILFRFLPILAAILGLYLMSFPAEFSSWKPWTRQLQSIGEHIFVPNADMGRFWPGVGAQFLCFSIQLSPELKSFFSRPSFTFLGGISFSMYLLHGPLMRSVLAWMVFGPVNMSTQHSPAYAQDPEYKLPVPSAWTFFITLPAYAALLVIASKLWNCKVEPYFGRATKLLQGLAARDTAGEISIK